MYIRWVVIKEYTTPPVRGQKGEDMLTWTFADVEHTRRWLKLGYNLVGMLTEEYPEQAKKLQEVLDTVQDIVDTEQYSIPF